MHFFQSYFVCIFTNPPEMTNPIMMQLEVLILLIFICILLNFIISCGNNNVHIYKRKNIHY